jgi:hypothetical protein
MFSNCPLRPIVEAYRAGHDCFTIVATSLDLKGGERTKQEEIVRPDVENLSAVIEAAEQQFSGLTVLALFASFQRFLIEHLQSANCLLAAGYPPVYAAQLAKKFEEEVDRWRFDTILGLFKHDVELALITEVKKIKRYRDWIAHQNPARASTEPCDRERVFALLTDFIEQVRWKHTPDGEARFPMDLPRSMLDEDAAVTT